MKWIERQLGFLDFSISCLMRRKAKNLSLLLVYSLIVFIISSVIFFTGAMRNEAVSILEESPEMIVQRIRGGRHDTIPIRYADEIKKIRGVRSVKARFWGYYYHQASKANYTLMVPEEAGPDDGTVKIGQGVLRTWGTVEENKLFFRAYDGKPISLEIAGSFEGDTELVTSDLILMSENNFRLISGVEEDYATDLVVSIGNSLECGVIAEKIIAQLPDTRPIQKDEILRTYESLFNWRSGYLIVMISGAFFAFLIFAWDKATGLSAEEKMEIGVLKGLGWDTGDIIFTKIWEGAVISLSAFLTGVLGGYLHVFGASATIFEHAIKGWAVLYPEFSLYPSIDFYQLSVLFFLTVVPYTFISIIPAWRVSSMDPDTVMRQ